MVCEEKANALQYVLLAGLGNSRAASDVWYFDAEYVGQFDNSSDEPEMDETRKFMGIPNTPVHQFTGSDIDELD